MGGAASMAGRWAGGCGEAGMAVSMAVSTAVSVAGGWAGLRVRQGRWAGASDIARWASSSIKLKHACDWHQQELYRYCMCASQCLFLNCQSTSHVPAVQSGGWSDRWTDGRSVT